MEKDLGGGGVINVASTYVVPVSANIHWNANSADFRLRVSTQVKRADGTRYEAEVEIAADLGSILNLLIAAWTGSRFDEGSATPMPPPVALVWPDSGVTYSEAPELPAPHDVGEADVAENADDVAMKIALYGP